MAEGPSDQSQADHRLVGWKLTAARSGWLAFFVLAVLTVLVALPARWDQLANTARDETDLNRLTSELLRAVEETLQPERVSVWMKE